MTVQGNSQPSPEKNDCFIIYCAACKIEVPNTQLGRQAHKLQSTKCAAAISKQEKKISLAISCYSQVPLETQGLLR